MSHIVGHYWSTACFTNSCFLVGSIGNLRFGPVSFQGSEGLQWMHCVNHSVQCEGSQVRHPELIQVGERCQVTPAIIRHGVRTSGVPRSTSQLCLGKSYQLVS